MNTKNKQFSIIAMVLMIISLITLTYNVIIENKVFFSSKDMYVELPEIVYSPPPEPEKIDMLEYSRWLQRAISDIEITVEYPRMCIGDSYRMFITAYCAEECGWNYSTSSGATCHRTVNGDTIFEPTTCAIDLRYFRYGTLFYVPSEDRVYVAEDTGPGVKGLWMDTYQEDMSDVYGYNTRYETVYVCWYEDQVEDYEYGMLDRLMVEVRKS